MAHDDSPTKITTNDNNNEDDSLRCLEPILCDDCSLRLQRLSHKRAKLSPSVELPLEIVATVLEFLPQHPVCLPIFVSFQGRWLHRQAETPSSSLCFRTWWRAVASRLDWRSQTLAVLNAISISSFDASQNQVAWKDNYHWRAPLERPTF